MTEPLLDHVVQIVNGIAGPLRIPSEVGPETPLSQGGYWLDSTELLEVMLACEEAFGPVFEEADGSVAEALASLGTLSARVRRGSRP